VVEGGCGPGLGPEPAQEGVVVGQRRVQHLDRHPAAEAHVVGQEHVPGTTTADRRQQPVAVTEDATDVVGHSRRNHDSKATVPDLANRGIALLGTMVEPPSQEPE